MQKITMFTMASCPYCRKAHKWMEKLFEEYPQYAEIPIAVVDETEDPATADKYDYYYVPAYYVGGEKVHEGAASYDIIRSVFEKALSGAYARNYG